MIRTNLSFSKNRLKTQLNYHSGLSRTQNTEFDSVRPIYSCLAATYMFHGDKR